MTTATATPSRIVPKFEQAVPKFTPPRIVLNAVEGWGKTTMACFAPKPAIVMAKGETGYDTLLGNGLVPAIPKIYVSSWQELIDLLDGLRNDELPFKTLALDAMNGFEKLCHTFVCARDFKNDWSDKGFGSFQKGYETSVNEWIGFLNRLDYIRGRGVMVILLGHVQVRPFKNPLGPDYDRYTSDVHQKTWGVTAKWADAILFGNFLTITDQDKQTKRHKGIGGKERLIYTERSDAWDAKNRYSMPEVIDIPNDPKLSWSTVWQHIYRKESQQ